MNLGLFSITIILVELASLSSEKCDQHCSKCTNTDICLKCDKGYSLSTGTCYPCQVTNCKNCEGNPKECRECKGYYFWDAGQMICDRCSVGCQQCNNKKSCLQCGFIFKFTDQDKDECKIDPYYLALIICAFLSPCVGFWLLVYFCCLKDDSCFMSDNSDWGMPRKSRDKRMKGASAPKKSKSGLADLNGTPVMSTARANTVNNF